MMWFSIRVYQVFTRKSPSIYPFLAVANTISWFRVKTIRRNRLVIALLEKYSKGLYDRLRVLMDLNVGILVPVVLATASGSVAVLRVGS